MRAERPVDEYGPRLERQDGDDATADAEGSCGRDAQAVTTEGDERRHCNDTHDCSAPRRGQIDVGNNRRDSGHRGRRGEPRPAAGHVAKHEGRRERHEHR